jgi:hypothetical protein
LVLEVDPKRFDNADEIWKYKNGKFELVDVGGVTIGRATCELGRKWSVDAGEALDKESRDLEHVGLVIS